MEIAEVVVPTYIAQDRGGWDPFSIPNSSFTLNSLPAFFLFNPHALTETKSHDIFIFLIPEND